MILDDFSMGLDPGYRRLFVEYLRDYARSRGTTVFLTSHIIQDMEKLIDDCIVMDYGRILVQMPAGDLLGRFRRDELAIAEGAALPDAPEFHRPTAIGGRAEFYSFETEAEVAARLRQAGIACDTLRSDALNLEDAFIGLTGKY